MKYEYKMVIMYMLIKYCSLIETSRENQVVFVISIWQRCLQVVFSIGLLSLT